MFVARPLQARLRRSPRSIIDRISAVARAFSSARLSLGGVTVTNTGADVQDIATLIGRTQGTKPGGAAGGSAGMLGFDDRKIANNRTDGPAAGRNRCVEAKETRRRCVCELPMRSWCVMNV